MSNSLKEPLLLAYSCIIPANLTFSVSNSDFLSVVTLIKAYFPGSRPCFLQGDCQRASIHTVQYIIECYICLLFHLCVSNIADWPDANFPRWTIAIFQLITFRLCLYKMKQKSCYFCGTFELLMMRGSVENKVNNEARLKNNHNNQRGSGRHGSKWYDTMDSILGQWWERSPVQSERLSNVFFSAGEIRQKHLSSEGKRWVCCENDMTVAEALLYLKCSQGTMYFLL